MMRMNISAPGQGMNRARTNRAFLQDLWLLAWHNKPVYCEGRHLY